MRKNYISGAEPIESHFPGVRPSRISQIADGGFKNRLYMEAEKDDKFYLLFDYRGMGLHNLMPTPESVDLNSLIVQEFDSEEERAQEIAYIIRQLNHMTAQVQTSRAKRNKRK